MSGNINDMKQNVFVLGVLLVVRGEGAGILSGVGVVAPILGFTVGIDLVKFQNWARIGGLTLPDVNSLNFSLGTALGFHGFWTLLSKETEAIFT